MPKQVIPRVNTIYSNILVDGLPNTPYVQEKRNMTDLNLTSQWQQNVRLRDGYMGHFTESYNGLATETNSFAVSLRS